MPKRLSPLVPVASGTALAAVASDLLAVRLRRANAHAAAIQARDVLMRAMRERAPDLIAHGCGVARLAVRTGTRLGLRSEELVTLARAAELHDVGKVAIPDEVLRKAGPLSAEDWRTMRRHTILGERILTAAPALAALASIVRSTHERFDGRGYPDGLADERIPLAARIIFACDAYDAMISERPYARSLAPEEAREELRRCANTQFDPHVVATLCAVLDDRAPAPEAVPDGRTSASSNGAPCPAARAVSSF